MKVSTRGRYGLRAMIDLAMHTGEGRVSLGGISERQDLSLNYLESIFAVLKRAGIVSGMAGAQGGYVLAVPPEQITLQRILETLEGSLSVGEEQEEAETDLRRFLRKHVWNAIDASIEEALRSTTLADMVARIDLKHRSTDSAYL